LEVIMAFDSAIPTGSSSQSDIMLRRFLGGMSRFTLVMTVPQVWTIWIEQQAAGVSILSWGAYLLSAVLWFWFGLKQGDKNIFLPCIGWMVLNGAVVVGAVVYG
jgi:uncharacterized protein with PQ loop repeat